MTFSDAGAKEILMMMENQEKAEAMTDGELCKAVIDEVWGDLSVGSLGSSLLLELVDRFSGGEFNDE